MIEDVLLPEDAEESCRLVKGSTQRQWRHHLMSIRILTTLRREFKRAWLYVMN